ncbi:hypothetical protein EVG20_g6010 [Dentipellis fragilis]|uniref:Uncharacterized protein n=1 Tax=Dentipellis fragilis TaxID=205917 RepID=A0A4Y9YR39_9AGAM|nr:hypothetical protein EVG20_g6010 [Dentipellis fragilis]
MEPAQEQLRTRTCTSERTEARGRERGKRRSAIRRLPRLGTEHDCVRGSFLSFLKASDNIPAPAHLSNLRPSYARTLSRLSRLCHLGLHAVARAQSRLARPRSCGPLARTRTCTPVTRPPTPAAVMHSVHPLLPPSRAVREHSRRYNVMLICRHLVGTPTPTAISRATFSRRPFWCAPIAVSRAHAHSPHSLTHLHLPFTLARMLIRIVGRIPRPALLPCHARVHALRCLAHRHSCHVVACMPRRATLSHACAPAVLHLRALVMLFHHYCALSRHLVPSRTHAIFAHALHTPSCTWSCARALVLTRLRSPVLPHSHPPTQLLFQPRTCPLACHFARAPSPLPPRPSGLSLAPLCAYSRTYATIRPGSRARALLSLPHTRASGQLSTYSM